MQRSTWEKAGEKWWENVDWKGLGDGSPIFPTTVTSIKVDTQEMSCSNSIQTDKNKNSDVNSGIGRWLPPITHFYVLFNFCYMSALLQ